MSPPLPSSLDYLAPDRLSVDRPSDKAGGLCALVLLCDRVEIHPVAPAGGGGGKGFDGVLGVQCEDGEPVSPGAALHAAHIEPVTVIDPLRVDAFDNLTRRGDVVVPPSCLAIHTIRHMVLPLHASLHLARVL